MSTSFSIVFALLAGATYLTAQDTHGSRLFGKYCAPCHGANAKGGRAPDLTGDQWQHGSTDREINQNIREGIPGTQMPAFPLAESDAAAIVRWLRSLQKPEAEPITGNAATGRQIFFGTGKCSGCHMVGGRGGRFGPDLSAAGQTRSVAQLREDILQPDAHVTRQNAGASITTTTGRQTTGVIAGEDTYSLYLRDRDGNTQAFRKNDLRSRTDLQRSLMPKLTLDAKEVNDIVAFLKQPSKATGEPGGNPSPGFDVSFTRLLKAASEPQNWLTYSGDLEGTRYSRLSTITPANVAKLTPVWNYQFGASNIETTPIVVDGTMFVTGPLNNATALDARTGFPIWQYRRTIPAVHKECTVMTNRGFAVLGDRLYMATLDTHLVALDARTGSVVFDVEVDDYRKGLSITLAPLAIDGKIIVGVTAGECALTGFIDAYDAKTGKRLWRTWSIAQPGDPARASWAGRSAEFGGGPTWMTGTYDASTDTLFWNTGNPSPDYDGSVRAGDNLYTCSVLALDPATGKRKWYFQFTPHDTHDWDANETPVLIDADFRGKRRKLLIQANRNAFFYVLDRETGEFLLGKPFARQTWAKGLDDKGRPIVLPNTDPTPSGTYVCPDAAGATNWNSPSYDLRTRLFYVSVREACATYSSVTKEPIPGDPYVGTGQQLNEKIGGPGAIRAIDPLTGNIRWNYPIFAGSWSAGVMSTAGGVLFAASKDGYLTGLDSSTGRYLWKYQTGAEIRSSPISFAVEGKQYIAVSNDSSLIVFGLADQR